MKKVLATLEELLPEGIEFLEQMVDMESPTFDKPLVDKLGKYVAGRFESVGGQVSFTPVQGFGNHLRVGFAGQGDRPILLLGHIDTVFPAGEVARRPFRIEGDIARGPGVFDMKAGIAMMWMAIRTVIATREHLSNPVTVLLTSDEEVGGASSQKLIEEEAKKAQAVLVLEPSLPGGILKTARKGVGRFTLKAIGKAAHSGINPADGINSIEEISHQVLKLQSMTDTERGTTVTVGVRFAVASGEARDAAPLGGGLLTSPIPVMKPIRTSPGWAGLAAVISAPSGCRWMIGSPVLGLRNTAGA